MLAQLCGPKDNESEMGAAIFTKNDDGRNFDFSYFMRRPTLKDVEDFACFIHPKYQGVQKKEKL